MKKISKKTIILFEVIFSLAVVLSFGSCINECDVTNSTILMIQLDSAGKGKSKLFRINHKDYGWIDTLKRDTIPIRLNLSADAYTVDIQFLKSDSTPLSEINTLIFNYSRKPFNRGPDCGMDIRINDLEISNSSIIGDPIDSVKVIHPILGLDRRINVKIYL